MPIGHELKIHEILRASPEDVINQGDINHEEGGGEYACGLTCSGMKVRISVSCTR